MTIDKTQRDKKFERDSARRKLAHHSDQAFLAGIYAAKDSNMARVGVKTVVKVFLELYPPAKANREYNKTSVTANLTREVVRKRMKVSEADLELGLKIACEAVIEAAKTQQSPGYVRRQPTRKTLSPNFGY